MAFTTAVHRVPARERAPARLTKSVQSRWARLGRRVQWTLIILVVLFIIIRAVMPYAIKAYVNHQLDKVPEYGGRIGDVDVHLFRGAYQVQNIQVLKTSGHVPVPFFTAKKMDLSMEWKELFHGSVVGEVVLEDAELNFVAAPTEEESQTGKDRSWGETLESLFPFKLNRFEIRHGRIHFRNFHSKPPVDIYVEDLSAVATNLTNSRDVSDKLPAGLVAQGTTFDGGNLAIDLKLNPMMETPAFELNGQLTNVNLTALNDFLMAYGKFDVERGKFAAFTSVAAAGGRYEGYVKVFMEDIDVFNWGKEKSKNVFKIAWQAIVASATTVFKNQPRDQIASKVPIAGNFEQSDVGLWAAVSTLLQNAFIRALIPRLDQSVNVEDVGANRTETSKATGKTPDAKASRKEPQKETEEWPKRPGRKE